MIKRLAERFFEWYCNPDFHENILGDLNELFHRRLAAHSQRSSEWRFTLEVLLLFRPAIIRPLGHWRVSNTYDMFRNFLTIGLRNLRKHPAYTLIHVFGLALGLTAFLFINHYAAFERNYDAFLPAADRLYRVTTDQVVEGKITTRDAMSFAPSGPVLRDELPEVENYTTTLKPDRLILKKGEEVLEEKMVVAADTNFLDLFGYPVLAGDPATMLREPYSLVLTPAQARKYFGGADPIGQTIEVRGQFNRPFTVTGLIEEPPEQTHYKFNTLVSLGTYREQIERDSWSGYNYYTYLRLAPGADPEQVRSELPALSLKHIGEEARLEFHLQPVLDIHLYSDFTFEPETHGSAKAVYFLSLISVFILLIAWVNYINLSTARAIERAQEVGLRKVVGAKKGQLIGQFLVESLLINLMGALLALTLAQLLIPYFNQLVGKTILTNLWNHPDFLIQLGVFFLLGALVTDCYPAFVLSSFRPIGVIKGVYGKSRQGAWLRKALVVVQFAVSLILITSTVIVYQQLRFMTGRDYGINTDRVIGFTNPDLEGEDTEEYQSQYRAFTEEVSKLAGVDRVGGISNIPGGGSSDISSASGGVRIVGKTELVRATVYLLSMTDRLQPTLGFELISGRNFDAQRASDTSAVIINQAMLDLMNIPDPEEVINEYIQFGSDPNNDRFLIVGVIDDYNRSSLKTAVEPSVLFHYASPTCTVVKLSDADLSGAIDRVKGVWNRFFPDSPFTYAFVDERFDQLYRADKQFGLIFLNFALLAIFVGSIGLFGLSSYLALQRTKEVGVRKVLGASAGQIVMLFFKDFLLLIGLAVLIGLPLIYLGMSDWLASYAYRIDFPWWVLPATVALVVLLAFVTVSAQAWRLALLNPARVIRQE